MKISAVLSLTTVFSLNQNGSCTFLRSTKENNDVSVPDSLERKLGVQCCYAGTCINPGELLKGYICLNNGNWGTSPKKCCKNNKCVSPREYHIGPTETCQCSKWGGNWGNNGGFKNCKPNPTPNPTHSPTHNPTKEKKCCKNNKCVSPGEHHIGPTETCQCSEWGSDWGNSGGLINCKPNPTPNPTHSPTRNPTKEKKCCKNNKCVSPGEHHIGPTETCQCSEWGGDWGNNGGLINCKPNPKPNPTPSLTLNKKCCKNNKCVSPREYHIGPTETCQCSKWGGNWGNNGGFKNCKPNNSWEWGRTQSVKYHQNYQSFCRRDELHDKGRVDEQYELIFMDTFNICKERCDSMVSCTGFEYKKIDKYEKNCKIWFEVVHRFNTAPDRGRHATCFWKING